MKFPISGRTACARIAALFVVAATAAGVQSCGDKQTGAIQEEKMQSRRPLTDVLNEHVSRLMAIEGVVGVYEGVLGDGTPCITIMVKEDRPRLARDLPPTLEGYPVRLEIGGEIKPLR